MAEDESIEDFEARVAKSLETLPEETELEEAAERQTFAEESHDAAMTLDNPLLNLDGFDLADLEASLALDEELYGAGLSQEALLAWGGGSN